MWKTLYQSVIGSSHQLSGQPCQDSCAVTTVEMSDGPALVLACSDGAGSASLAEVGSRIACDVMLRSIAHDLSAMDGALCITSDQALKWLTQVHLALIDEAQVREVEPRDLACTLLFAVIGRAGAGFGQIGDGAIVVLQDDHYETVFWPQSGEYINSTNFISDARFHSLFDFSWRTDPFRDIALLTDGLQMLCLHYQSRQVHTPFFAPMFRDLRDTQDPNSLSKALADYLSSSVIVSRTDDDKTLVLATRVDSNGSLP